MVDLVVRGGTVVTTNGQTRVDLAIESGLHWLASCQVTEGMAAGSWAGTKYPPAVSGLATSPASECQASSPLDAWSAAIPGRKLVCGDGAGAR